MARTDLIEQTQDIADPTWLDHLRGHKRSLSPAEGKVARLVLADPARAMRMSITELAELAGVGDATVSRLARRLGFDGFHAFKIAIAQDLAPASAMRSPLASSSADYPSWALESATRSKADLDETLDLFDADVFTEAVRLLVEARRIDLYGSGTSGVTAAHAQQRFTVLGLSATAHMDNHVQLLSAATLTPRDVVLAISQSGSTRDVHAAATVARRRGAKVVCITAMPRSPMTEVADATLVVGGNPEALVSNLFDQMPITFMVELLAQGCFRELGSAAIAAESEAAAAIAPRIF
jgi:DNA-binding MurR/RpiR family transcriptional regulator